MLATIQIHVDSLWRTIATFESASDAELARGIAGRGSLLYDVGYVAEFLDKPLYYALSAQYPVSFEYVITEQWPAFLVDLLPGGAGRRFFYNKQAIPQAPSGDWPLLLAGVSSPPGHLRIKESFNEIELDKHSGFTRQEVLDRQAEFIEYAYQHGAPVAGSSDVQGDSPKFLLVEDHHGRWHAEGAVSEAKIKQHWLVKFPRGKQDSDRAVLFNEAAYYCVAAKMGLRTYKYLTHESNTLFVPRFDRVISEGKILRYGQESLYSLARVSEFGKAVANDIFCEVIAKYASNPQEEVAEFICRDILNVAMGNTDNHGRNTAMQYLPDGTAQLTPLFDFAPMILDDSGISRVCRWQNADNGGYPDWSQVVSDVAGLNIGVSEDVLRKALRKFLLRFNTLSEVIKTCGVEEYLIERIQGRIDHVKKSLEAV
jgi:serine/threonine-protein kinase HipA